MSSLLGKAPLTDEQLLAEVEDALRVAPPFGSMGEDTIEQHAWFGRVVSLLKMWDSTRQFTFEMAAQKAFQNNVAASSSGAREIMIALQQARHDLRIRSVGPLALALPQGAVFDYFDQLRKLVESAQTELFFIDPYLDAEFAGRYLRHVKRGVSVRLLGKAYLSKLLPAVDLIRQQESMSIEVRSTDNIHDRALFIDGMTCYQSGASFKDGPKNASTTLAQLLDSFDAVKSTYEKLWENAALR